MSEISNAIASPNFEVSPKLEINAGLLVLKFGDIKFTLFEKSGSDGNVKTSKAAAIGAKLKDTISTNTASEILKTNKMQEISFDGQIRKVLFIDKSKNYQILNSMSGSIDLAPAKTSDQSDETVTEDQGSTKIYKKGGTTIRVSSVCAALPEISGYEQPGDISLVDVVRQELEPELFIVIYSKTSNGSPDQSDLSILTDEGRVFYLKWPLEKLGDGTYGVVYAAHNHKKDFAVKILYDRQFATRTGVISASIADLESLGIHSSRRSKPGDETRLSIHFSDLIDKIIAEIQQKANTDPNTINQTIDTARKALQDLLGSSDQATNLAKMRFQHESEVTQKIFDRKSFQADERARTIVPSHYVEVVAATSSFRKSKAYETIQNYFDNLSKVDSRNLSDYAIIMEYCSYTLKDLLEREWMISKAGSSIQMSLYNDKPLSKRLSRNDHEDVFDRLIGYKILERLPYKERMQVALPFLLGVANGLTTLHSAGLMHHDIKPGNVFVQVDRNSFEVLLGDFSFVAPAAAEGSTEAVLRDVVNTGTPHFRSPEQRDFSEIYHAQVLHAYGDEKRFALRIVDPKFEKGLSAAHDRVVFSSDKSGYLYHIESIIEEDNGRSAIISLTGDNANLRAKFPEQNQPTQIYIYKIPSIKSDLFGFGALAYDMISGGRSAERFYEVVRAIDNKDYKLDINEIVKSYQTYLEKKTIDGDNGNLRAVFRRISAPDISDACPPEFFRLIISCITMNIKGSYASMFDGGGEEELQSPFGQISEIVSNLGEGNMYGHHILLDPERSEQWKTFVESFSSSKEADGSQSKEGALVGSLRKAYGIITS